MGNKIITEEDFWVCSGGNVPAPFQTTQLSTKKAAGHKYITVEDKSTLSWVDFGCKKLMLIMAIIAAVVVVAVVATGGAALAVVIAAGAAAGAAGAAYGAVLGALICGQKAAVARKWLGSKRDLIIQGQKAITGDHKMACAVFGEIITFAPEIKNWWQAIALSTANYFTGIMEGMLAGAAIGLGGGLLAGGSSALAAGGMRGLGQAALQGLKSLPRNLLGNVASSFGKGGLAMRGLEGISNVLSQYGSTGRAGVGDFLSGVVSEETDAYNAVKNIATGNGTWQDAANLALLLAPDGGGGKPSPNTATPPTADANANQPAPAPDADANPAETDAPPVSQSTDSATPAPIGEFDAFEGGPATPTTATPTPTDAQTIRENVLRNIEASRRARESSNYGNSVNAQMDRAANFYREAGWSEKRIADHIAGIDFTKPVEIITIPKGTEVVQWQQPGRPTGNYFAPPGTLASELGIYPGGRQSTTYTTNRDVTVLRSTAKDVVDTWSVPGQPYQTQGGGIQYFVPDPGAFTPKP